LSVSLLQQRGNRGVFTKISLSNSLQAGNTYVKVEDNRAREGEAKKMIINLPLTEYVSFSFQELLELELKRAYRGKQPFSLTLLSFPSGTQADRSLLVLQETLRDTDTVFRHSEASFLVFMPMTNKEGLEIVVERLKQSLVSRDYLDDNALGTEFKAISVTYPEDGDSKNVLLKRLEEKAKNI